jgi:hypothetical protein
MMRTVLSAAWRRRASELARLGDGVLSRVTQRTTWPVIYEYPAAISMSMACSFKWDLPAIAVYRRGELVMPRTQPNGRRQVQSGFSMCISEADFHEFEKQIGDAIESLELDRDVITQIRHFPGVDDVTLDFGIRWENCVAQFDRLPSDLITLAGNLGLAIEISHYPVENDSRESIRV